MSDLKHLLLEYQELLQFADIALVSPNQVGIDEDAPIHVAARAGNSEHMIAFIRNNADINQAGDLGNTPLHWASACGNIDTVRLLVESGARCDVRNEFLQTPLDVAQLGGHYVIVDFLRSR